MDVDALFVSREDMLTERDTEGEVVSECDEEGEREPKGDRDGEREADALREPPGVLLGDRE